MRSGSVWRRQTTPSVSGSWTRSSSGAVVMWQSINEVDSNRLVVINPNTSIDARRNSHLQSSLIRLRNSCYLLICEQVRPRAAGCVFPWPVFWSTWRTSLTLIAYFLNEITRDRPQGRIAMKLQRSAKIAKLDIDVRNRMGEQRWRIRLMKKLLQTSTFIKLRAIGLRKCSS